MLPPKKRKSNNPTDDLIIIKPGKVHFNSALTTTPFHPECPEVLGLTLFKHNYNILRAKSVE